MDPEEVELRLPVAGGISGPQIEEDVRDLLGRIVADRLLGRLTFGVEDERGRRMTQCMSSPTDVVSDSAYKSIQGFAARAGSPFSRRHV
jgi:hypothetical protein